MRVAAVAFVLIVGAAVVLAFANTLNSWVLGGLLGGLAAILLCIPVSLAIFALLTRRHEARQRATTQALDAEEDAEYADEMYEDELYAEEDETRVILAREEAFFDQQASYPPARRGSPISGYLPLPPAETELDPYDDFVQERQTRREPRNYPRQPRYPARSLTSTENPLPPPPAHPARRSATRSLSQHQSAALRKARQEARQLARQRNASDSLTRRSQGGRSSASQRPRSSHAQHFHEPESASYRSLPEYDTPRSRQQSERLAWHEEEDLTDTFATEELRERYPRRPAYPRHPRSLRGRAVDPWTGELDEEEELEEELRARRPRRDPERFSGNLHNPLVRRAPYLYEDDPLNEEFARQLDNDHPITRRSSRNERYRDDEED